MRIHFFRRRVWRGGWLALLLAWCAAGCVRVEQTLILQPDGSGIFIARYGMALEDLANLETIAEADAEEGGAEMGPISPFEFDEAQVREDFESYRPMGVTLLDLKTETADGWRYLNLRVAFQSLEGLGQTEFLSDRSVQLRRLPDGAYELTQAAPQGEGAPELPPPEMVAEVLKGFRAVLRVRVPGEVVESNADRVDGSELSWIYDVDDDAQTLIRAQRVPMRVVFKGVGLNLKEYRSPEPAAL